MPPPELAPRTRLLSRVRSAAPPERGRPPLPPKSTIPANAQMLLERVETLAPDSL